MSQAGLVLATLSYELPVFRTVVFSIVIAVALGQNASVLCLALCDQHQAAAPGCHDEGSTESARLGGGKHCEDSPLDGAPFLKEDLRRVVSAPHLDHVVAIPRHVFAAATTAGLPDREPGHLQSLDTGPLVVALRI